jgi:hypothetical protein
VLAAPGNVLPFRRLAKTDVEPFINAVPLIDLKFAAGHFSEHQDFDREAVEWVELPSDFKAQPGRFVAQVVGESMNRHIPNGSWCLFKLHPAGTRAGKVVVAQYRSISDPDLGGSYTVKVYRSDKTHNSDGTWRHSRIELCPDSHDPMYQPIVIDPKAADDFRIVAELIAVL